jgi:hypothetical protein
MNVSKFESNQSKQGQTRPSSVNGGEPIQEGDNDTMMRLGHQI